MNAAAATAGNHNAPEWEGGGSCSRFSPPPPRRAAVLIWARLLFEMNKVGVAGDRVGDCLFVYCSKLLCKADAIN